MVPPSRDYRSYAQDGSKFAIMRRQTPPSNRLDPIGLLLLLARDATSRAWDNPVVSLPPGDSWRPRDGAFLPARLSGQARW